MLWGGEVATAASEASPACRRGSLVSLRRSISTLSPLMFVAFSMHCRHTLRSPLLLTPYLGSSGPITALHLWHRVAAPLCGEGWAPPEPSVVGLVGLRGGGGGFALSWVGDWGGVCSSSEPVLYPTTAAAHDRSLSRGTSHLDSDSQFLKYSRFVTSSPTLCGRAGFRGSPWYRRSSTPSSVSVAVLGLARRALGLHAPLAPWPAWPACAAWARARCSLSAIAGGYGAGSPLRCPSSTLLRYKIPAGTRKPWRRK